METDTLKEKTAWTTSSRPRRGEMRWVMAIGALFLLSYGIECWYASTDDDYELVRVFEGEFVPGSDLDAAFRVLQKKMEGDNEITKESLRRACKKLGNKEACRELNILIVRDALVVNGRNVRDAPLVLISELFSNGLYLHLFAHEQGAFNPSINTILDYITPTSLISRRNFKFRYLSELLELFTFVGVTDVEIREWTEPLRYMEEHKEFVQNFCEKFPDLEKYFTE